MDRTCKLNQSLIKGVSTKFPSQAQVMQITFNTPEKKKHDTSRPYRYNYRTPTHTSNNLEYPSRYLQYIIWITRVHNGIKPKASQTPPLCPFLNWNLDHLARLIYLGRRMTQGYETPKSDNDI